MDDCKASNCVGEIALICTKCGRTMCTYGSQTTFTGMVNELETLKEQNNAAVELVRALQIEFPEVEKFLSKISDIHKKIKPKGEQCVTVKT